MKQGNDYAVCDPQARYVLQAAEQTWHDWILPYLAARRRHACLDWALQPLPGLRRVCVTLAAAPTPHALAAIPAPRALAAAPPAIPALAATPATAPVGSHLRPIDISHGEVVEAMRTPQKRKFLGVIDICDDEEASRPAKKLKYLGIVDLTN